MPAGKATMTSLARRRSFTFVVGAVLLGLAACTGAPKLPGAKEGPAPVGIEVSQMFITVDNRSGGPLTNVTVVVIPVGAQTLFTTTLYRLENAEKRDLSFSSFRGRDGTPFDRRVVRTKAVKVTATDVMGKPVEVEVPWR